MGTGHSSQCGCAGDAELGSSLAEIQRRVKTNRQSAAGVSL